MVKSTDWFKNERKKCFLHGLHICVPGFASSVVFMNSGGWNFLPDICPMMVQCDIGTKLSNHGSMFIMLGLLIISKVISKVLHYSIQVFHSFFIHCLVGYLFGHFCEKRDSLCKGLMNFFLSWSLDKFIVDSIWNASTKCLIIMICLLLLPWQYQIWNR